MNEITINVVISDRNYTITINRDEEENIRRAVKDINEKVKNFSQMYAYKDKQDLLAMAALQISTENLNNGNKLQGKDKKIEQKITEISVLLDNYLNK